MFPKSHAVAALNSALYLSCPAGTTISSTPTPRHTHTQMRTPSYSRCVCACAKAGTTVLCLSYALVRLYDPQTSMPHSCGFPFLELTPQTCIAPTLSTPPPPLASIASCHVLCLRRATLRFTYTVHAHIHQTPAYLKEPVLFLHLRHRI